ncbi:formyltransferase family protein [Maridesulfovibrio sp.]|uniref:formyltransferase family protein n=1 Tax=Maridesulfovibrio sp. TaxID=2795000 RepID=UPI0039EF3D73
MAHKILFLGYDKSRTCLIKELEKHGCTIDQTTEKLDWDKDYNNYNLIVSFGYSHIIPAEFLEKHPRKTINLHISYLPFNRGAHPNFWAFYDGTPHGVTIHEVDQGVDTGDIIYQKKVSFSDEKNFAETYARLISEIEQLFIENIPDLLAGDYTPASQQGEGTYHKLSDLPDFDGGWEADIEATISALKMSKGR